MKITAIAQHCMDAGELAPLVTEFTRHLSELGHTSLTVSGYDAAARHLAQWLALVKIAVANIDGAVVDRFAQHRCRCPGIRRDEGSVQEVREAGMPVRRVPWRARDHPRRRAKSAVPMFDQRVVEFQEWLRQHRGITELTIGRHGRMVMRLLPALGSRPQCWDAPRIRDAILAETKRVSLAYVKTMTMALRGYLRFLGARGLCRAGLEHAVPTIPQWRLSTLPRYIGVADVEQLIATCDPTTPAASRDRADPAFAGASGIAGGRRCCAPSRCHRLASTPRSPFAAKAVERRGFRCPQDAGDAVLDYLKRGRPCVRPR